MTSLFIVKMKNRNRITFEAKGLQQRLEKLAVEPNQPLASIVRSVLMFGLAILENRSQLNQLNLVIVTGLIALLEIEVRNHQPITLLVLEFTPTSSQELQHLQIEATGVLGSSVFHNYRVGDEIIVKGQLSNTGELPPKIVAHQIIPFKLMGFVNLLKEF